MALIGFEGFDNLGITPSLDMATFMPFGSTGATWNASVGSGLATGKSPGLLGGFGIRTTNFSPDPRILLNNNYSTIIIGFRYQFRQGNITDTDLVVLNDTATAQCGLSVNATSGNIYVWRGTTANVLGTGSTFVEPGGWYMIELKATIDNSAGSMLVRLDERNEINLSGINNRQTANSSMNTFHFLPQFNSDATLDDVYVCDTTGPAPFNDFLGAVRVETLFVTGNNSVTWTPLSGTNASNVDEVNMDSDTTYNSNTTTGIDTFTHGFLSSTPITIFSTDVISSARKTDVKLTNYRNKLISGATTSDGTNQNLATVYTYLRDSYLTDPNTGIAWTAAGVDSTDIGYERF